MDNSKTREQLIEEFLNTPIKNGEVVTVTRPKEHSKDRAESAYVRITADNNDGTYSAEMPDSLHYTPYWLDLSSIPIDWITRHTGNIGQNPIKQYRKNRYKTQIFKFDIDSILSMLGLSDRPSVLNEALGSDIPHSTFNPFVTLPNGEKYFYQRGLVWSLEDKQNLIESVYRDLDCGKIVVRQRAYNFVEDFIKNGGNPEHMGLYEIVDGKQRINALYEFVHNVFPDKYGNYWKDLSKNAQSTFRMTLTFSTVMLREDATDRDTLTTFQNVNTRGVAYNVDNEELNEVIKLL